MLYRNARTGEVYESPNGRDGRLEAVADDPWLPVGLRDATSPFDAWTPPASVEAALVAVPADEQETP